MRVGISVYCTVCGLSKKPHGRSGPLQGGQCDTDCPGYDTEPYAGCLWPGESEKDFGFPICDNATEEAKP